MAYTISYDTLVDAALDANIENTVERAIRADYSGRGMYGDKCFGFVHDDLGDLLRFVMALRDHDDDVCEWIDRCSQDSMGRSAITYWPNVTVEGAPVEDDDDDEDDE